MSADHTDRYDGIDDYAQAKNQVLNCLQPSGYGILNADDSFCRDFGKKSSVSLRWFSLREDEPLARENGISLRGENEAVRKIDGGEESYHLANPRLIGRHNRSNMLAAIECARGLSVSQEDVQDGLLSFNGLEHRIELVATQNGIRWYNDSKATNVASVATALHAMDGPVILIAGGTDKGGCWDPLLEFSPQIKAVLAIGEASPIVLDVFAGQVALLELCGELKVAVNRARELADEGDVVLLSPACSSFDQFDSYAHRGCVFRDLVLSDLGGKT